MAQTIRLIEPGIYQRKNPKTGIWGDTLWFTYSLKGKTKFESAKTTKLTEARTARAQRIAAVASGTPVPGARLTVGDLLDRVLAYYRENGNPSLRTAIGHVRKLRPALGHLAARQLETSHLNALRSRWLAEGIVTKVTINKRFSTLRRALSLAFQSGELARVIFVPMFTGKDAKGQRGKYISGADHALLAEHLPDYVVLLLDFARLYGVRRGQLSRTRRAWVDRERRLIGWPAEESKTGEPHTIPLDEAGLTLVEKQLALSATRPWCPYLFHGPQCAPGRRVHHLYGCVGDFKKAWNTACAAAGLPVGRKAGGYTFHHTRNTAVTDMLASGTLSTAEAMAISNHKTEAMIKHYNLGNIEALRERLERARVEIARLTQRDVTR